MRYDTSRTRRVRARAPHGEDDAGTDGSPVPIIPGTDAYPAFDGEPVLGSALSHVASATE